MTEAPTNHGVLTDKEGTGFPGCRILADGVELDRSFTVMSHVQKYLDNIEKKARVCFTTKDGKISKIWPEPVAPSEAQKVIDQENSAGDARKAANDAYVKELAGAPKEPKYIDVPVKPLPKEAGTAIVPAVIVTEDTITTLQPKYSNDELLLLRHVIAKDCTEPEFKMMMYMAKTYGLDPLLKQIWAIKRNERDPALIMVGRDGMLAIAHRSKQFDGMTSGVNYVKDKEGREIPVTAWCEIWRKDMTHSFKTEVRFDEYVQPIPKSGYKGLWQTKPSVMLIKVAESVCLRKAFSVSGVYDPDEITERA